VPLDIVIAAIDRTGKPGLRASDVHDFRHALPSGSPSEVNVQSHLELQATTVCAVSTRRRAGSGTLPDITVPNFDNAPLAIGDERQDAGKSGGATKPTTRRAFSAVRSWCGAQIYQGTERTDALAPVVRECEFSTPEAHCCRSVAPVPSRLSRTAARTA
jgi:hypothetical protein